MIFQTIGRVWTVLGMYLIILSEPHMSSTTLKMEAADGKILKSHLLFRSEFLKWILWIPTYNSWRIVLSSSFADEFYLMPAKIIELQTVWNKQISVGSFSGILQEFQSESRWLYLSNLKKVVNLDSQFVIEWLKTCKILKVPCP